MVEWVTAPREWVQVSWSVVHDWGWNETWYWTMESCRIRSNRRMLRWVVMVKLDVGLMYCTSRLQLASPDYKRRWKVYLLSGSFEKSLLTRFGRLIRMPLWCFPVKVFWAHPVWEETSGQTQNTPEGLHIPCGLKEPGDPRAEQKMVQSGAWKFGPIGRIKVKFYSLLSVIVLCRCLTSPTSLMLCRL